MVGCRWLCNESGRPSLTIVPEDVIRDKVVSFLDEGAAFKARGTCMLFSTAYFNQVYKRPNGARVFAMLLLGYKYRKLKTLSPKWCSGADISFLKGVPALNELSLTVNDLVLKTIPDNLINLQKLDLSYCNLLDI